MQQQQQQQARTAEMMIEAKNPSCLNNAEQRFAINVFLSLC
jgi:hypothetical protein